MPCNINGFPPKGRRLDRQPGHQLFLYFHVLFSFLFPASAFLASLLSCLLPLGLSHVAIEFITGMFPRALSSGKIEVVQISIQILTWLPVFRQISTQTLFGYPQQVRFLVRVYLQNIDRVFVNFCNTSNHWYLQCFR